jgi:hypothetical protein
MIIVELSGGLGNQMFQYAFGKALSKKSKSSLSFRTDAFEIHSTPRQLELQRVFGLQIAEASDRDLIKAIGIIGKKPYFRNIISKKAFKHLNKKNFNVEDGRHPSKYFDLDLASTSFFKGYWQSERYFSSCNEEIRKSFTFKPNLNPKNLDLEKKISSIDSIAIHVRRGDYLTKAGQFTHGVLPDQYYISGIKTLLQKKPNSEVFAFSDDPEWTQSRILSKIGFGTIVEHNFGLDSYQDMKLMSLCNNIVIANSSFSWWAAWLNKNKNKTVIAPRNWFSNKNNSEKNIVPSSWHEI